MTKNGDDPERACELECRGLQGLPGRREFVGPVKIVLIESTPLDYRRKTQLLSIPAILMISPFFGGGMLLNRRNRNFQHFLLQISGLICGMTSFGLMAQNLQCSFHGLTGIFGVVFALFASFFGPGVYHSSTGGFCGRIHRKAHVLFGLFSFLNSTACFFCAFLETKVLDWIEIQFHTVVLMIMIFFYTLCVLGSIFIKSNDS
ncbi:uncharacterized protein LOC118267869 [Spodoptera frugiperda]|uniref:Uncharacterized protein LOC118267869 n=1 Tax=Spodoptera frugiperda TaxID=7108 RepID=A0A9R0D2J4_SPOFR|nr:uncharacterized protein LOC118267869 [Spodoptera frugiperda]